MMWHQNYCNIVMIGVTTEHESKLTIADSATKMLESLFNSNVK